MHWKRFSSDVTSLEGALRVLPPPPPFRFEEAWKRFDRLNAAVHGGGPMRWLRTPVELVLFGGAGLGLKFLHHNRALLMVAVACYAGVLLAYTRIVKNRFEHWQCPRCHAEWPGTKKEKDSRCRTCGLRLHELG